MPIISIRSSMVVRAVGFFLMGCSVARAVPESDTGADVTSETSQPRVRVAANNAEELHIRDRLNDAVQAANSENLDGFVDCFTGNTKSKIRKQAAIRFVQHDVAMELLDTQVIKVGKTTGEVAVRYRLLLSDDRFDVVALVAVKQEHGYWRIKSETIQSYEHQSSSMCSPSRYACLGATCRVAAR